MAVEKLYLNLSHVIMEYLECLSWSSINNLSVLHSCVDRMLSNYLKIGEKIGGVICQDVFKVKGDFFHCALCCIGGCLFSCSI